MQLDMFTRNVSRTSISAYDLTSQMHPTIQLISPALFSTNFLVVINCTAWAAKEERNCHTSAKLQIMPGRFTFVSAHYKLHWLDVKKSLGSA